MSATPYRKVLSSDPVEVLGRRVWFEVWAYAREDVVFTEDTLAVADCLTVIEGEVCASSSGRSSLKNWVNTASLHFEEIVRDAEKRLFSLSALEDLVKEIERLTGILQRRIQVALRSKKPDAR